MFPRDIVCLRNTSVDTLHKGDANAAAAAAAAADDDDNNNNNSNNNSTHPQTVQVIYAITVPKMYTSVLKLVCIHNDLLHVSANHVAIFREIKYKCQV